MKFITTSLLILLALYGLVFAAGDAYLSHMHAPLWMALALAAGVIAIQYLVSPWFIEWLMTIVWDDSGLHLPAANRAFVLQLCARRGIRVPRIGVIFSGTPNAFSFGHTPGNARVVVTQGLLDVLTPEEVNAVLAHEIGHVEHWDFAVMAIAALAPLLLYQMYVFGRSNNNTRAVAWGAYGCYVLSQFIYLSLNRTREYMADDYAAHVTGTPNELSSALVKIACGLVRSDGEYTQKLTLKSRVDKKTARDEQRLSGALGVLGISNVQSGAALALGGANPADAVRVMRWDLVNPWARLYELNSTHPLTAFRVRALNRAFTRPANGNQVQEPPPTYPLPANQAMEWGWFPLELLLWALPVISACLLFFDWVVGRWSFLEVSLSSENTAQLLVFTGAAWILRTWYRYHGEYRAAAIGDLIQDAGVSQMRARAVQVEGEIVGLGVPGVFWCPDLVLRDSTGMLFVLYRQSIPFARFLFALMSADELIGKQVAIEGWFRRGLKPYIEMSTLTTAEGTKKRAWSRWVQYALATAAVVAGCAWLVTFR